MVESVMRHVLVEVETTERSAALEDGRWAIPAVVVTALRLLEDVLPPYPGLSVRVRCGPPTAEPLRLQVWGVPADEADDFCALLTRLISDRPSWQVACRDPAE